MGTPDVSILLPVWNGIANYPEGFLQRAIDSVLFQQPSISVELCIVDDGSTDETAQFLGLLTDKRIKLAHNPHLGPAATLNDAADMATGRYMIQFSTRTWFELDGLNHLVQALDEHPEAGFAYGRMQLHGVWNFTTNPPPFDRARCWREFRENFFLYRAEAYHAYGCRYSNYFIKPEGYVGACDKDFLMQMIVNLGWSGIAVPDHLIAHYYRSSDGQLTDLLLKYKQEADQEFFRRWGNA